jgi:hypothetical protein
MDQDELHLFYLLQHARLSSTAPAVVYCDGLPRLPYSTFVNSDGSEFLKLMRAHGFVILIGCTEGASLYRLLENEMRTFFLSGPCGSELKARCVGGVYENERGVPMWHCGYEFVEDCVREAFRVHAKAKQGHLLFPSAVIERRFENLAHFCQQLTDRALLFALAGSASTRDLDRCRSEDGDFSVSYALHYPNSEGGAPALSIDVAGVEGINVKVRGSYYLSQSSGPTRALV